MAQSELSLEWFAGVSEGLTFVLCPLHGPGTDRHRIPTTCVIVASFSALALSLMGPSGDSWGCTAKTRMPFSSPFSPGRTPSDESSQRLAGSMLSGCGVGWIPYLATSQPSHKAVRNGFLDTSAEVKPQVLFLQIAELPGSDCLHRCLEAVLSLGTQPG